MNSEKLAMQMRRDAVLMTNVSNGSHIGSVLSIVDIIAVLYQDILSIDKKDLKNCSRDRFILSKGHAGAALYSVLARKGFFSTDILKTHYANGSLLSAHVSHKVPGVEFSTGSLGHGICVAAGIALHAKRNNQSYRVFTVMGDGECEEGSTWEMALFAKKFALDNLVVIVDHNKMQALGDCADVLALTNVKGMWETFGWTVIEVDGHNHLQLKDALSTKGNGNPMCIVANTIKGKGISFMENELAWHYRSPQGEDYVKAMQELGGEEDA